MKTLDQIEPRIPLGPEEVQGDFVIDEPGNYYFTSSISANTFQIDSVGVILDLSGYELKVNYPLEINGGLLGNIVIRNGRFDNSSLAIYNGSVDLVLDSLDFDNGNVLLSVKSAIIKHCTFEGHYSEVGVQIDTGSLTIQDSTISEYHQGLIANMYEGSFLLVEGVQFVGNEIGVELDGYQSHADFKDCLFDGAITGGSSLGDYGVIARNANLELTNCSIRNYSRALEIRCPITLRSCNIEVMDEAIWAGMDYRNTSTVVSFIDCSLTGKEGHGFFCTENNQVSYLFENTSIRGLTRIFPSIHGDSDIKFVRSRIAQISQLRFPLGTHIVDSEIALDDSTVQFVIGNEVSLLRTLIASVPEGSGNSFTSQIEVGTGAVFESCQILNVQQGFELTQGARFIRSTIQGTSEYNYGGNAFTSNSDETVFIENCTIVGYIEAFCSGNFEVSDSLIYRCYNVFYVTNLTLRNCTVYSEQEGYVQERGTFKDTQFYLYGDEGVHVGFADILNCSFTSYGNQNGTALSLYGIGQSTAGSISNCTFNLFDFGIYSGEPITIERSRFNACNQAIHLEGASGSVIDSNIVTGSQQGMYVGDEALVTGNRIIAESLGIEGRGIFAENQIIAPIPYSVYDINGD